MHFVRKVVPLAAFFGFLAVIFGGTAAYADVTSLSPVSTGQTITITATYTNSPVGAVATIDASGGVNGNFTAATASGGTGVQASGVGSKQIKTSPDNSGNTADVITISATFTCQGNGPVSFLLFQAGGTINNKSAQANCSAGSTSTSTSGGAISVTPSSQAVGQTVNVQAACQNGSVLSASPSIGSFTTATLSGAAVTAGGNSITCSTAGQLSANYNCTTQGATTFTLSGATGASAALTCGAGSQQSSSTTTGNTGLTLANPSNSGRSSPVTISVSPDVVPCSGTASITVTASLIANASVQDGTVVNLYTTNGVIDPKNGVIKDGKFVTTLKGQGSAGPVTINASVGGVTNYLDTKFDCGVTGTTGTTGATSAPVVASTPASQPISSPPPPPPPPSGFPSTGGIPVIAPPNTGDAGLLALLD